MNRLENFRSLKRHVWFSRLFKKLTSSDIQTCEEFILSRSGYSDGDYCLDVLQWGVDKKIDSKNYPIMNELLLVSGTIEVTQKKKGHIVCHPS